MSLKGLATGIGSLPFTDADEAVDLVLKYLPQIPFWPQLPKRDIREGMLAQFSENLPCLKVTPDGLFFDGRDKDKELEKFYERVIAQDSDYFKISANAASGLYKFYQRLEGADLRNIEFIKCHVTGPFTFASSVTGENKRALLHDDVFMQAILKGLAMKALWQINFFRKFGKKMIIFFDEPYLASFGSAYSTVNRESVVSALSEFTAGLKSQDVLTGVHCCGNTDWSIFTDIETLDIINFDAFGFLDRLVLYADNLKKFFKRGGILCWGIVPTSEFSGKETVDLLAGKIKEGINLLSNKGLDKDLLTQNLLLSPACGLGTLSVEKSEQILKLLSEASLFAKNKII